MSEWYVMVIKLGKIQKLPNSDNLSITDVDGGYPCIIRTGDFNEGDLAVYIPVDSICPDVPEFEFLGDKKKIKAKRLRGTFSMGLLVKPKFGMKEGEVVDKEFGITKYEPEIEKNEKVKGASVPSGEDEKDPGFLPVYTDIESLRKYKKCLVDSEEVVLTEKTHGANGRWVYSNGRLWVGSHKKIKRTPKLATKSELLKAKILRLVYTILSTVLPKQWIFKLNKLAYRLEKPIPETMWWRVAREYGLEEKLRNHPDIAIYGEVYGQVQDLKYGAKDNEIMFRMFDAMDIKTRQYMDYDDFVKFALDIGIEIMPVLYRGPWDFDKLYPLCNGKSTFPGVTHCREGFVVRPIKERQTPGLGRTVLKLVGEDYLLRKEK